MKKTIVDTYYYVIFLIGVLFLSGFLISTTIKPNRRSIMNSIIPIHEEVASITIKESRVKDVQIIGKGTSIELDENEKDIEAVYFKNENSIALVLDYVIVVNKIFIIRAEIQYSNYRSGARINIVFEGIHSSYNGSATELIGDMNRLTFEFIKECIDVIVEENKTNISIY